MGIVVNITSQRRTASSTSAQKRLSSLSPTSDHSMISRTARIARLAVQSGSRRVQPAASPFKLGALRSISISACENVVAPTTTESAREFSITTVDGTAVDPLVTPITTAPLEYIPTYINDSIMGPFDAMEFLLASIHTGTGAEWAVVIAGTTAAVRLCMSPVIVGVMKNSQRLQRIQGQVSALTEKMNAVSATDPALVKRYTTEINALFTANNCHPFKSIRGILIQMPVFMGFFFAIRRIAECDPTFAASGGSVVFPWLTDLSIADPYHICPIVTAATMALTVELGADGQQVQQNPMAKNVMRAFAFLMVPFTWNMPAGLFCYWITSNICSLTQVSVLKIPPIRDAMGMLAPPPEEVKPGSEPVNFIHDKPSSTDAAPARKTFGRKSNKGKKRR